MDNLSEPSSNRDFCRSAIGALEIVVLQCQNEQSVRPVAPVPPWFHAVAAQLVGASCNESEAYNVDPLLPFAGFADAVVRYVSADCADCADNQNVQAESAASSGKIDLAPLHCDIPLGDGHRITCSITAARSEGALVFVIDKIASETIRRRAKRQMWRTNELSYSNAAADPGPKSPVSMSASDPNGTLPAFINSIIAATNDGIIVTDTNLHLICANDRAAHLLGLSPPQIRSRPDWQALRTILVENALSKNDVRHFCDCLEGGISRRLVAEWKVARPFARRCEVTIYPTLDKKFANIGLVWIVREYTVENSAAAISNPIDSQGTSTETEQVGRLAAGLAHDFNNLLAVMIGNLSQMERSLQKPSRDTLPVALHEPGATAISSDPSEKSAEDSITGAEFLHSLTTARSAADRAAEMVRKLLSYSRNAQIEQTTSDLNNIILETIGELRESIPEALVIQLDLEDNLWTVDADNRHVAEVLTELCQNAADAIGPKNGIIQIQSRNLMLSDIDAANYDDLKAGKYAVLSITDNGRGIAINEQEQIFEPFFTTKNITPNTISGGASGMGLASARGTIRQLGGDLTCSSLPGQGAVFTIYLPSKGGKPVESVAAVGDSPIQHSTPARKDDEMAPTKTAQGLDQCILVVDDDPSVRDIVQRILRKNGYSTSEAEDGLDAIASVREANTRPYDLIILDLCMPRMGGAEAYRILNEMGVQTPVVISSGYVVELNQFEKQTGIRPAAFLPKPYSLSSLLETAATAIKRGALRGCNEIN